MAQNTDRRPAPIATSAAQASRNRSAFRCAETSLISASGHWHRPQDQSHHMQKLRYACSPPNQAQGPACRARPCTPNFSAPAASSRHREDWVPEEQRYLTYEEVPSCPDASWKRPRRPTAGSTAFTGRSRLPKRSPQDDREQPPSGLTSTTAARTNLAKYADVKLGLLHRQLLCRWWEVRRSVLQAHPAALFAHVFCRRGSPGRKETRSMAINRSIRENWARVLSHP